LKVVNEFAFGGSGICEPCFEDGSTNIPLRLSDGELVKGMAGSRKPAANRTGYVGRAFSADGKHFVFESNSRFATGAINGENTVYDRDLSAGTTQVVSTLPSGSTMTDGEGEVGELDVSGDGSYILVGQKVATDVDDNSYWHLFMHVGANASTFQQEVLEAARHVRQVCERHTCLVRRAIGLASIARRTRGDQVRPDPGATARLRQDVFALEVSLRENLCAVRTGKAVAAQELAFTEPRSHLEQVSLGSTPQGDDRMHGQD